MKKCVNPNCNTKTNKGTCVKCAKAKTQMIKEIKTTIWWKTHSHEKLENYSFVGLTNTLDISKRWISWATK
jgi:hypothetical protein